MYHYSQSTLEAICSECRRRVLFTLYQSPFLNNEIKNVIYNGKNNESMTLG